LQHFLSTYSCSFPFFLLWHFLQISCTSVLNLTSVFWSVPTNTTFLSSLLYWTPSFYSIFLVWLRAIIQ
jgi:hypothetical protein